MLLQIQEVDNTLNSMGKMTLRISEEEIVDPPVEGSGRTGVELEQENSCLSTWNVSVKTTSSCWVEWTALGGTQVVVTKVSPAGPAINGETLTEITGYVVVIDSYRSPNESQNDIILELQFRLRESELGAVIDTKTLRRYSTDNNC